MSPPAIGVGRLTSSLALFLAMICCGSGQRSCAEDPKPRKILIENKSAVSNLQFSADGKTLIFGDEKGGVYFWDLTAGKETDAIEGVTTPWCLTPDGKLLAMGFREGEIKLIETATKKDRRVTEPSKKGMTRSDLVVDLKFSNDAKSLVAAYKSGRVLVWETAKWQPTLIPSGKRAFWANGLAVSADGKWVATGSAVAGFYLHDAIARKERGKVIIPAEPDIANDSARHFPMIFSSDAKFLVAPTRLTKDTFGLKLATGASQIKVYSLPDLKELTTIVGPDNWVQGLAISPDLKTIAASFRDGSIKLWDLASGKEKMQMKDPEQYVETLAFSPDGKTLASGSTSYDDEWRPTRGRLLLWDVK